MGSFKTFKYNELIIIFSKEAKETMSCSKRSYEYNQMSEHVHCKRCNKVLIKPYKFLLRKIVGWTTHADVRYLLGKCDDCYSIHEILVEWYTNHPNGTGLKRILVSLNLAEKVTYNGELK